MRFFPKHLLSELAGKAQASERRRAHLTLHSGPQDPVQRFFVTAVEGTYFRPHRHAAKAELAIVLEGEMDLLTFDEQGTVIERTRVGSGAEHFGFETPAGTWHTLIVVTPTASFLEVKQGPYDPATASEFAPWAPAEGGMDAAAFNDRLAGAAKGTNVAQPKPGPETQGDSRAERIA